MCLYICKCVFLHYCVGVKCLESTQGTLGQEPAPLQFILWVLASCEIKRAPTLEWIKDK